MEFWRTDEIAPIVLIILFELMVLGLIIECRSHQRLSFRLSNPRLMKKLDCAEVERGIMRC